MTQKPISTTALPTHVSCYLYRDFFRMQIVGLLFPVRMSCRELSARLPRKVFGTDRRKMQQFAGFQAFACTLGIGAFFGSSATPARRLFASARKGGTTMGAELRCDRVDELT